jgi:hypothetical protein
MYPWKKVAQEGGSVRASMPVKKVRPSVSIPNIITITRAQPFAPAAVQLGERKFAF